MKAKDLYTMDIIITTAPTPNVEAQLVCANSSNLTTVALSWTVRHNGIVTIASCIVCNVHCLYRFHQVLHLE